MANRGTRHTPEVIAEARRLIAEGKHTREVAEILGCSCGSVSRWAHPQDKFCPSCRKRLPDVKGMRFCAYCGSDIRSKQTKLAEDLGKVLDRISTYYPANLRDEAVIALNNAIDYLNKEDR